MSLGAFLTDESKDIRQYPAAHKSMGVNILQKWDHGPTRWKTCQSVSLFYISEDTLLLINVYSWYARAFSPTGRNGTALRILHTDSMQILVLAMEVVNDEPIALQLAHTVEPILEVCSSIFEVGRH